MPGLKSDFRIHFLVFGLISFSGDALILPFDDIIKAKRGFLCRNKVIRILFQFYPHGDF